MNTWFQKKKQHFGSGHILVQGVVVCGCAIKQLPFLCGHSSDKEAILLVRPLHG